MFNRDNRSGGRGGKKYGNRDSSRPMTMHRAICSECNKECEVPFRPNQDKPVFCRDCFKGKDGGMAVKKPMGRSFGFSDRNERSNERSNGGSSVSSVSKEQFDILNTKLDRILRALEM